MAAIRTSTPFMEGDDGYWPVLDEFQRLESFHAFAHHPAILDVCDTLFGEKTLVHRGILEELCSQKTLNIQPPRIRIISTFAARKIPTPGGFRSARARKSWVGCLCLLVSHRFGIFPVKPALGAGGLGIDTAPLEADGLGWVSGDFALGDALFFHSPQPCIRHSRIRQQTGFASRWITGIRDVPNLSRKVRCCRISIGWVGMRFTRVGIQRSINTIGTLLR